MRRPFQLNHGRAIHSIVAEGGFHRRPTTRQRRGFDPPEALFLAFWIAATCVIQACGVPPGTLRLQFTPVSALATWSPDARAAFEAGVGAAQLGDWDGASHQFRTSMRIESHTETMIDFAYVERARGHYRVAIAALDSLLALPDASHPNDIRAAMAALQRHVGSLMIYTTPENARVEVDDVRVVGPRSRSTKGRIP